MKISFLDDEPELFPNQCGGKARTILNLAEGMTELSDIESVTILSRSIRHKKKSFYYKNIHFERLDDYSLVRRIIEETDRTDILNVHNCSFTMPYLTKRRAALCYHLHDIIFATADAGSHMDKALGNNWSSVISPSQFASNSIESISWWSDLNTRLITIPRGINQNIFYPVDKKTACEKISKYDFEIAKKISQSYPVILFPNRVIPEKGADFLSTLYEELVRKFPAALIIAPSGLKSEKKGITSINWIQTDHLKEYYSVSDVTLALSMLPESFCQVALESLACRTPVIGFRFGNMASLIDEFPAIKQARPSNKNVVDSVLDVLDSKMRGINESLDIIKEKYSIVQSINKLHQHYQYICGSALKQPNQMSCLDSFEKKYFTHPFVATYTDEAFYYAKDRIYNFNLSKTELEILDICRMAKTKSELIHKINPEYKNLDKLLTELKNKHLMVEI